MANYTTTFYLHLRKHINKTIAFNNCDSMGIDMEKAQKLAKLKYEGSAIPIEPASFDFIGRYFRWVYDRDSLFSYDNTDNLWHLSKGNVLLENFLQDYFEILKEIAEEKKDWVMMFYAQHFFKAGVIRELAFKIRNSYSLRVDRFSEVLDSTENLRYFEIFDTKVSEGGKYRALVDLSKKDFELNVVDWKDTFDKKLTRVLPMPISTDEDDEPKLWLSLIRTYMCNDESLIEYFEKVLAYIMSPYNYNQVMINFFGSKGKNGKSTVIKVLQDILGPHTVLANRDLINANPPSNFKKDDALASLEGKSLVIFNELDERMIGSTVNIKELTEGGRDEYGNKIWTTVRPAYSPNYRINLCGIPLLVTNSLLNLGEWTSVDSIFRRLIIIPFNYHIEVEDPEILNRLAKEYPKIELWLYRNYYKHYRINLKAEPKPDIVQAIMVTYRTESDLIKMFVDECLEFSTVDGVNMRRSDLYTMYQTYCRRNGRNAIRNRGSNGFQELISNYISKDKVYMSNGIAMVRGIKPSQEYIHSYEITSNSSMSK